MKLPKSLKIVAMLSIFATSVAAAENLIEIAAISENAVPGSRDMPHPLPDRSEVLHVMTPSLITTADVAKISSGLDPLVAQITLSDDGAKKFAAATADMKGKRIAIIVQGKVLSAPVINSAPLGRAFELSGFKDSAETKAFIDAFNPPKG